MKILLSGAGGFLGSHLLQTLAQRGTAVTALTSKKEALQDQYAAYPNVYVSTMEELRSGNVCLGDDTILINCAFPRNADGVKMASGLHYVQSLLETAVNNGVCAVINISSQSVYSQTRERPADEQEPLNLESSYAVGKYAAELLVNAICRDVRHTNLRMASLIGPGFDQRVVNKLVRSALQTGAVTIRESGQRFGFLDVEDAVSGILCAAEMPTEAWKPVYNLGPDGTYTLSEMAQQIKTVLGSAYQRDIEIKILHNEEISAQNTALDCALLRSDTGFRPAIPLEESIRRIAAEQMQGTWQD